MIPPTTYVSTTTFADSAGVLFNPTTVTVSLKRPDGSTTVYTTADVYPPVGVTNPSTGVFKLKVDCTAAGTYFVEWSGTGASGAASERSHWTLTP